MRRGSSAESALPVPLRSNRSYGLRGPLNEIRDHAEEKNEPVVGRTLRKSLSAYKGTVITDIKKIQDSQNLIIKSLTKRMCSFYIFVMLISLYITEQNYEF